MLDHLIDANNLWSSLERYGLTLTDLVFIKELVYGPLPHSDTNGSRGNCDVSALWWNGVTVVIVVLL